MNICNIFGLHKRKELIYIGPCDIIVSHGCFCCVSNTRYSIFIFKVVQPAGTITRDNGSPCPYSVGLVFCCPLNPVNWPLQLVMEVIEKFRYNSAELFIWLNWLVNCLTSLCIPLTFFSEPSDCSETKIVHVVGHELWPSRQLRWSPTYQYKHLQCIPLPIQPWTWLPLCWFIKAYGIRQ